MNSIEKARIEGLEKLIKKLKATNQQFKLKKQYGRIAEVITSVKTYYFCIEIAGWM